MRKLRKIQKGLQPIIDSTIEELLENTEFKSDGIKGYIADVARGMSYRDGQFTVPLWAYDKTGLGYRKQGGYFKYYVAHELSHQISYKEYDNNNGHNENFYKVFMKICPKDIQHFELNYKPSAKKYGITKPKTDEA